MTYIITLFLLAELLEIQPAWPGLAFSPFYCGTAFNSKSGYQLASARTIRGQRRGRNRRVFSCKKANLSMSSVRFPILVQRNRPSPLPMQWARTEKERVLSSSFLGRKICLHPPRVFRTKQRHRYTHTKTCVLFKNAIHKKIIRVAPQNNTITTSTILSIFFCRFTRCHKSVKFIFAAFSALKASKMWMNENKIE